MVDVIRALVLGDVVGKPGRRALFVGLKKLVQKSRADLVIANGENAADGRGMLPADVDELRQYGVDVITSGNHIWQKKEILPLLDSDERLLRPENYPRGVPGRGYCVLPVKGVSVAVCNLEGRRFLSSLRCPFKSGRELAGQLHRETRCIIVDFHAEDPEEKEALGLYLDGAVSAVLGTHTHIQTADQRILPGGTGYITDIGMTGPIDSCIGMQVETAIRRNLTQMPLKMEVEDKPAVIRGVYLEIDAETGRSLAVKPFNETSPV